ncbi:MAG: hypothetical protein IPL53_15400 [Ignavibacteria bacterium]|nr:hypothetical protein [Ignavibacteria bacterium]
MKNKQINKTLKVKSGKDLVSLLDSKIKQSDEREFTPPSGETQITLLNIWKSLLVEKNFGVSDDFFQIGGNSIKAIQLLSRISSHFKVQLETTDIFLLPTITQLASLIEEKQNIHDEKKFASFIEKSERPSMIPLSFSQERLIFIDKLEGSLQYHLPAVIRLKGKLNKDALESALRQTVNRHESLRTIFTEKDGISYQKIQETDKWTLEIFDGRNFKDDKEGLKKYIQKKLMILLICLKITCCGLY